MRAYLSYNFDDDELKVSYDAELDAYYVECIKGEKYVNSGLLIRDFDNIILMDVYK